MHRRTFLAVLLSGLSVATLAKAVAAPVGPGAEAPEVLPSTPDFDLDGIDLDYARHRRRRRRWYRRYRRRAWSRRRYRRRRSWMRRRRGEGRSGARPEARRMSTSAPREPQFNYRLR